MCSQFQEEGVLCPTSRGVNLRSLWRHHEKPLRRHMFESLNGLSSAIAATFGSLEYRECYRMV